MKKWVVLCFLCLFLGLGLSLRPGEEHEPTASPGPVSQLNEAGNLYRVSEIFQYNHPEVPAEQQFSPVVPFQTVAYRSHASGAGLHNQSCQTVLRRYPVTTRRLPVSIQNEYYVFTLKHIII